MKKTTICICENDTELTSAFVFATRIVQLLYFLNPKFQASINLLCLYSSVCVEPVRKPHCWFSHEAARFCGVLGVNGLRKCFIDKIQSLAAVTGRDGAIKNFKLFAYTFA